MYVLLRAYAHGSPPTLHGLSVLYRFGDAATGWLPSIFRIFFMSDSIKTCIATDKAPAAIGPYSQATVHGKTAYISGCIGLIPGAEKPTLAGGGIEGQTRQCLENLKATVEAAGGKMNNVCKTTVLLSGSMESYPAVNAIYAEYFPVNPPARAAFAVAGLPAGGLIEIECVCALE